MKNPLLTLLLLGFIALIVICCNNVSAQEYSIPHWIKNNAKWWYDGKIDDSDFSKGIQYLINQGIIKIPNTTSGPYVSQQVPIWVRTISGGWGENRVSDQDFINGIRYLVEQGIIKISLPQLPSEFVKVDHEQVVVSSGNSVQVNVYGKVDRSNGGKVILAITKPDGTTEEIQDFVTNDGDFSSPIILDSHSPLGQYEIIASYQNQKIGSFSFNVVSESSLPTPTNPPTNTPSTSNNLTQGFRSNVGGLYGSNVIGSCPIGQEIQYSSSNSTWVCSKNNSVLGGSYIISKSGSTYSAKNGTTNKIEFSDTSATKVVQSAINSLSSRGGKIVFETGTYPVSIMVTKTNLAFEGQGYSTILTRDGDKNIFNISGNSHSITRTVIKNMKIVGDPKTYQTDCIYAKETSLMIFDTLQIQGCYGNGINFEEVYDSRILNSLFIYDGNQAQDKAALYFYSGLLDSTNNIYVMNCDFEAQQGDDVISKGLDLANKGNYMINFLQDKFESHSNLVKHHLNFINTKGSVIESSFVSSASDSNVYLAQSTADIKFFGNFFTNNAYPPINPPTYDIDIQGKNMILIGNNFERATVAHINIGPSATSAQIFGNSYDLTNGEKSVSGNLENVVKLP